MAGASFKGINWLGFGILDDHGKIITGDNGIGDGVLIVDGDAEGATTANVTGIEEKGTPQYANNKVKRMAHGSQTPSVAITMLDMDYRALMKMKGYDDDGKGGFVLNSGKKPHVALLICTSDFNGDYIFEGFANGEMIEASHNHGTNNKNETDANATLEYDVIDPLDDTVFLDSKGRQRSYKAYYQVHNGFTFAEMFKEVFGGYVLSKENAAIIGAAKEGQSGNDDYDPTGGNSAINHGSDNNTDTNNTGSNTADTNNTDNNTNTAGGQA